MKTPITAFLFAVASAATLPAAVTITTTITVPNGSASGGSGSGGNSALTTSFGTFSAPAILQPPALPSTTYTVGGIDLTSVGGTANESFTFTVTYTATTDGSTPGTAQFNGFGNVAVTGGADSNQVDGAETLTATVALTSTSFANLSLTGFTLARAGGVGAGETGTFTWQGGSFNLSNGNTIASAVSGNFFTLTADSGSRLNLEGFEAQFEAVPEPGAASLLAVAALALLRRRRSA